MSQVKVNKIQLGQSATATNNFVVEVPNTPDGSMKIARGNVGATTQDVLTISSNGSITIPLSNYANDTAAATGGVPIGGLYRNGGDVKVRIT
jgi:hypothetical protein